MAADTIDYTKGETPMTDKQFLAYVELRDKYEALLQLRVAPPGKTDDVLSDYQFKRYEQIRDKCEKLGNELILLRKENASLKMQVDMLKSGARRSK